MNTSIQTLSFQNFPVSFRADGYLNATEIAEHFGKRINNYLRNERTQEYISALIEFLNTPETQNRATAENQLVIVKKGGNDKSAQGTWLHPKLAIDFARWLNPKFAVWCDMQIEKILHSNSASPKPTKDERTGLRQAVTMLVGKADINHSAAYKLVHHRFGVASIEDLTHEQIPQAIEYVHRLILDGEVLEKPNAPTLSPEVFKHIQGILNLMPVLMRHCQRFNNGLQHITGLRDYAMSEQFAEHQYHIMQLAQLLHLNCEKWRHPLMR